MLKSAHNMSREFHILSAISGRFPVPRPLIYCDDASLLDGTFYLSKKSANVLYYKTNGVFEWVLQWSL